MSPFTALWLGWLAMFLIVECAALTNRRPGDTLSEHVWKWFASTWKPGKSGRQRTGWEQFRRFLLLAGMVWLTLHFLTGGWV